MGSGWGIYGLFGRDRVLRLQVFGGTARSGGGLGFRVSRV